MNRNLIVWLFLIALTFASYFSSSDQFFNGSILTLMGFTILKFSLVGFQFMELRNAHVFWRIAFFTLIVSFLGFVTVVYLAFS